MAERDKNALCDLWYGQILKDQDAIDAFCDDIWPVALEEARGLAPDEETCDALARISVWELCSEHRKKPVSSDLYSEIVVKTCLLYGKMGSDVSRIREKARILPAMTRKERVHEEIVITEEEQAQELEKASAAPSGEEKAPRSEAKATQPEAQPARVEPKVQPEPQPVRPEIKPTQVKQEPTKVEKKLGEEDHAQAAAPKAQAAQGTPELKKEPKAKKPEPEPAPAVNAATKARPEAAPAPQAAKEAPGGKPQEEPGPEKAVQAEAEAPKPEHKETVSSAPAEAAQAGNGPASPHPARSEPWQPGFDGQAGRFVDPRYASPASAGTAGQEPQGAQRQPQQAPAGVGMPSVAQNYPRVWDSPQIQINVMSPDMDRGRPSVQYNAPMYPGSYYPGYPPYPPAGPSPQAGYGMEPWRYVPGYPPPGYPQAGYAQAGYPPSYPQAPSQPVPANQARYEAPQRQYVPVEKETPRSRKPLRSLFSRERDMGDGSGENNQALIGLVIVSIIAALGSVVALLVESGIFG